MLGPDKRQRWQTLNVSRRDFLRGASATGAGLVIGIYGCSDDDAEDDSSSDGGIGNDGGLPPLVETVGYDELDAWVAVGDDGSIRITVHRSEMGQGVRTSMAMLVAEELCADWNDVVVQQATGDSRYGDQNTDASASVRMFYEPLRQAGAQAREMLIAAAADELGVDAAELVADDSEVKHEGSGESRTYAQLAKAAAEQDAPSGPPLKSEGDFRLIGKATKGIDACDITMGKAIYGIDAEVEGMLHASIERSPTVGGSAMSYDEEAAMAVAGVRQVIKLEPGTQGPILQEGVAVLADNTWAAMQGRRALEVQWTPASFSETTADFRVQLADAVKEAVDVQREQGDVDAALASAARTYEAEYQGPYLSHAPMEPPVALADVSNGKAEIWAPTQDPQRAAAQVALAIGLDSSDVTVHVTLLGGGFGRKSQPDFVIEAAKLSQEAGAPVKVTWTREDDTRHGFYRAESRQLLRAGLDDAGEVTALLGRSVFPSIFKIFVPAVVDPQGFELGQGWNNWPFDIANMRAESGGNRSSLRIGWWRSVCNTFHAFSVGSFIDELASETGQDTVELFKKLVGEPRMVEEGDYDLDAGRLLGVVDRVASMGLWGTDVPEGEGIGFAAHSSFQSYVACVMHVAVDSEKKLTIKAVDYAVDCGRPVNPDGIEAQVEGGLVYGLTAALYSEITVTDGVVDQGNFADYPMMRIDEMPEVNVAIIDSEVAPTGVGEPPLPPVAPALTNAIFAATGERVRQLPIRLAGFT